ncbi:hypothetical protein Tco_1279315, partial [Tanacetum coccineum]
LEDAPTSYQQQPQSFPKPDSSLVIPVSRRGMFRLRGNYHMMSFWIAVVTSQYPTTNNQLRTSSNPRQQPTIYDEKQWSKLYRERDSILGQNPGHPDVQNSQFSHYPIMLLIKPMIWMPMTPTVNDSIQPRLLSRQSLSGMASDATT